MGETTQGLPDFLQTQVASRIREIVTAAEQRLAQAQKELDELRGARGTIAWEVGDAPPATWCVNIAGGEVTVDEKAANEPFATVKMSAENWARFVSGAAHSELFAGVLNRPLGRSRIERLRTIRGAVGFVLTGLPDGGSFNATVYFSGERPPAPQATIQMTPEIAAQIQAGQLNPQAAFMQGQMKLIGDMGFAMQVGIALLL